MRKKKLTLETALPFLLLIAGAIGVLISAVLTIETIARLTNPSSTLACDINPIISCGSVIDKPQASALGVPNTLVGIVGFSIVATIGAALLAGARFKRWFWRGLQVGVTFGMLAVAWLQYQSIYELGAICPFCLATWAIMIPLFLYTTIYNFTHQHIPVPDKLRSFVAWLQRNHLGVLIVWYLVIICLIAQRFWDYWSTLI